MWNSEEPTKNLPEFHLISIPKIENENRATKIVLMFMFYMLVKFMNVTRYISINYFLYLISFLFLQVESLFKIHMVLDSKWSEECILFNMISVLIFPQWNYDNFLNYDPILI